MALGSSLVILLLACAQLGIKPCTIQLPLRNTRLLGYTQGSGSDEDGASKKRKKAPKEKREKAVKKPKPAKKEKGKKKKVW